MLKELKTFIKFGIVGASGALINIIIFSLCIHDNIDVFIASLIGFIFAVSSNFIFNFLWTFKGRAMHRTLAHKYSRFFIISAINLCVNLIVLKLSVMIILYYQWGAHWHYPLGIRYIKVVYLFSQILGIGVATFLNFFGNSKLTFNE